MHETEYKHSIQSLRRPDPRPSRTRRHPLLSTRELREEVLRMVG